MHVFAPVRSSPARGPDAGLPSGGGVFLGWYPCGRHRFRRAVPPGPARRSVAAADGPHGPPLLAGPCAPGQTSKRTPSNAFSPGPSGKGRHGRAVAVVGETPPRSIAPVWLPPGRHGCFPLRPLAFGPGPVSVPHRDFSESQGDESPLRHPDNEQSTNMSASIYKVKAWPTATPEELLSAVNASAIDGRDHRRSRREQERNKRKSKRHGK